MIYLFYGEAFFVEQRLKDQKKKFSDKHGGENIITFDGVHRDTKQITETIRGGGLFATHKMIIIHGLPPNTTAKYPESAKQQIEYFYEYLTTHYNKIPSENIIIFTSTQPDKKTKRAKLFLDNTHEWIKSIYYDGGKKESINYIQDLSNQSIGKDLGEYLLELCNHNMYTVDNEIKKIMAYQAMSPHQTLDKKIIGDIVNNNKQIDVWSFLDGIIIDQNDQAIYKFITYSQQSDSEIFQFLGLLYRAIGGILRLINCREHGITQGSELATYSKLPPFTVSRYASKKDILISYKVTLNTIYHRLIEMDYKLKTGIIPSDGFWSGIGGILMNKNYHQQNQQHLSHSFSYSS